jgi:hypothetical protein
MTDLISLLADAIQKQEGYYPGSRGYRNNNPGNLWDGLIPGVKTKRIWPQYPLDNENFVVFPDYSTGRAVMENQIRIKIGRGETLTQLLNEWDSGDPASTRATYVSNVTSWTGLDPNTPLNQLGSGPPSSLPNATDILAQQPQSAFDPGADSGPSGDSGTLPASIFGDISPGFVIGLLVVGFAIWWFNSD